jgi:hypothetical protein
MPMIRQRYNGEKNGEMMEFAIISFSCFQADSDLWIDFCIRVPIPITNPLPFFE